jgi:uncharacterized membrane protein
MTEDTPSRATGASFSKSRLEAFSDGVLAIAITLLVLDIAVIPGGTPLNELRSGWPSYVGYVISFLTIGVAWIGHVARTGKLEFVDSVYVRLNLLFLLVVVFLPFPTKLVTDAFGDRDAERVAVTVYGVTLLLIRFTAIWLDEYAGRESLYAATATGGELDASRRANALAVALYCIAIVVGLLLPGLAVAIYFAAAIYLVMPFRELARLRARRGDAAT